MLIHLLLLVLAPFLRLLLCLLTEGDGADGDLQEVVGVEAGGGVE